MHRRAMLFVRVFAALLAAALHLSAAPAAIARPPREARSHPPAVDAVRLLSSTAVGVTFEVRIPWRQLRVISSPDGRYVKVSLPGWHVASEPGAPQVPLLTQVVGVPFRVRLSTEVQAGPAHTIALAAPLAPAPTQVADEDLPLIVGAGAVGFGGLPRPSLALEEDPAVYRDAQSFPCTLAEVRSDAVVRQQRVAGIALFAAQYHPAARELTIHEWIRVTVTFAGSAPDSAVAPSAESPAYEKLLRQTLLNYEAARGWRRAAASFLEAGDERTPWSPPEPGWRVKVRDEGFYKLTYAELLAAGLPVETLDPRTFQFYNLGSEVAIRVVGEEDGQLDPEDLLIFFGQAVSSKYTLDNVYWLTYGQALGRRMDTREGAPGAGSTPGHYAASVHFEKGGFYVPSLPLDDNLERWAWNYVVATTTGGSSKTLSFSLGSPVVGEDLATLSVALWGGLANTIAPDHHVRLVLNGTLVNEAWWDGRTWLVTDAEIPQALLLPGNNQLVVECPNDTGVGEDIVFIDWVELEFANAFTAVGDALSFGYDHAGTWKYQVDGFTAGELAVYDLTDPLAVERIEGIVVAPSGSGYAAEFQDTIGGPTRYWATATTAYRTVQAIEPDTPSDLQSASNGADYLVLAHRTFWDQAGTLAGFRTSQGLRAMRVDVQDVYDQFAYGITGAPAIHDFVAYAYGQWQAPAPTYLLLIGDGHYDPKNYTGYGRTSYLPPFLAPVDPWIGETAADSRYVTVAGGDPLPDLMLGRLAVDTEGEATALVDKILAYEENTEPGDWVRQVLAVADDADSGGDFDGLSDELVISSMPEPYEAQKVYYKVTHSTVAGARQAVQAGINSGALIVNYIGHAAQNQWANEGLFETTDVPSLTNGNKLPVLLPMTCWEGYYILPFPSSSGYDSMAEVVTGATGGGAVASWSPTGEGLANGHDFLNKGFFQAVFLNGLRSLGQAASAGKLALWASGSNLDLLDTYLLFGDPALEIHALDADLRLTKSVEPAEPVHPGAVLTYTLTFANTGPAVAHHVVLADTVPVQLIDPQVISASPEVVGLIPGPAFAWEIADLPAGAGGTLTFSARVATSASAGAIVNEAVLSAAEPDTQPADNVAAVSSEVVVFPLWLPLVSHRR